jgi:hypothetical protein
MQAMRSIFQVLEKKTGNNINFTITTKEVKNAISITKPSTSETDNNKYKIWQSQYSSC